MATPLTLDEYDVIICGGGTAGCVLANRLTEDENLRVLMLEAGENANDDPRVSTPWLFSLLFGDPERDWMFMTEPSPGLNNRRMAMARGKCLGGSSAINLMALIYPSKADLEAWAELGNEGWDFDSMKPYYRKFQRHCPPSKEIVEALGLDYLDPALQGTDGPIASSFPATLEPLPKAWVDMWKGLQKQITGDPMSGVSTGGYSSPTAINPETNTRSHAGVQYYAPVAHRSNLGLVTGALIDRVEFESSTPVVATGVVFSHQGQQYTVKARKEVVLCTGVYGSPAILERSGVGDKARCEELGIKNIVSNPSVGENHQDHLHVGMSYEVKDGIMTADMMRDPVVAETVTEVYKRDGSGPLGTRGHNFAYMPLTDFLSASPREDLKVLLDQHLPDGGYAGSTAKFKAEKRHYAFNRRLLEDPSEASAHLCMVLSQYDGSKPWSKDAFSFSKPGQYVCILPSLAHPFSRGSVHIRSADPSVNPTIEPQYLSHPLDLEIIARHLMQVEILASSPPLCDFLKPGGRRIPEGMDAFTLEHAKDVARSSGTSNYHPCGTCAMMPEELGGVVDNRLRIYGTKNLRVCDASIFPIQVRGNIMTTVYAIAEKGAHLIKQDLSPE